MSPKKLVGFEGRLMRLSESYGVVRAGFIIVLATRIVNDANDVVRVQDLFSGQTRLD